MATEASLSLGINDHGASLSADEFAHAHFEEPWRYELVQGKLIVMAPNGDDHVSSGEPILDAIFGYKLAHRETVSRVVPEAWIAIDDNTNRIADLAVYLKSARSNLKIPKLVPDLVVEIVSGGGEDRKRDYVDKRAEYLRIGVKEYVILDRFQGRLTVLRRVRGRFVESQLGVDDVYTSTLLPGLKIPLNGIL